MFDTLRSPSHSLTDHTTILSNRREASVLRSQVSSRSQNLSSMGQRLSLHKSSSRSYFERSLGTCNLLDTPGISGVRCNAMTEIKDSGKNVTRSSHSTDIAEADFVVIGSGIGGDQFWGFFPTISFICIIIAFP